MSREERYMLGELVSIQRIFLYIGTVHVWYELLERGARIAVAARTCQGFERRVRHHGGGVEGFPRVSTCSSESFRAPARLEMTRC